MTSRIFKIKVVIALTGLLCAIQSQAALINGGSSMLTSTTADQLETWLGEGPIDLTNIFTKNVADPSKDDSTDWHSAVDGAGRTFSIWEVTTSDGNGGFDDFIFGGYNPQSWDSSGSYHITSDDADRTAFIFNLTTGIKLDQCRTTSDITCGYDTFDYGTSQTFNYLNYGPTFGAGHDLRVDADLSGGYNYATSYGLSGGDVGHGHTSLLDNNNGSIYWVSVGALESFTIAASVPPGGDVPIPATVPLIALGLAGLGWTRRKKA